MPYYHLDILDEPELSGYFEVLTVPAVLIYYSGQEILRQARFLDYQEIEKRIMQLPDQPDLSDYSTLF
ncbi:hypothetical protein NRIC_01590 [Enterococcus florum]|uniref:Thioredoxin domain-containing protein n=1 Tax=Enterococcus florum TaxID=2480627 RepID=A0A4P5P8K4_9ENTE|nr:thioredoxin family protein [Enterococcus florum]GCF92268.1 hypothetical protein NRIC_01590 [Enterococcus florum]